MATALSRTNKRKGDTIFDSHYLYYIPRFQNVFCLLVLLQALSPVDNIGDIFATVSTRGEILKWNV